MCKALRVSAAVKIRMVPLPFLFYFMQSSSIQKLIAQLSEIIVGKDEAAQLSVACLLPHAASSPHQKTFPVLVKTTLPRPSHGSLGLPEFRRIQFTSDLLLRTSSATPSSTRTNNSSSSTPAPFSRRSSSIDEINRATSQNPERPCSRSWRKIRFPVEGKTYGTPRSRSSSIIATQNPREQIGTFSLPESQLDRFMLRTSLEDADRLSERDPHRRPPPADAPRLLKPVLGLDELPHASVRT